MNNKVFVICVEGVYLRNGRILLLRRDVEPFKGYWHVPGGHVEENETLHEALRREFQEETNLDCEVGRILDGRIEESLDRIKIVVTIAVTSSKGLIVLNSENSEYGWFEKMPTPYVIDFFKFFK